MRYIEKIIQKRLAPMQKAAQEAADTVAREVGREADEYAFKIIKPVAREAAEREFEESVTNWYGAYSPKRYNRSFGFYNAIQFNDPGSNGIGWEIKENMIKPSWNGGSYNIYGLVFKAGYHGGPVHGHMQPKSTPIPELFESAITDLQYDLQQQIYELGAQYFREHAPERLSRMLGQ